MIRYADDKAIVASSQKGLQRVDDSEGMCYEDQYEENKGHVYISKKYE